jgi:putative membrane protein
VIWFVPCFHSGANASWPGRASKVGRKLVSPGFKKFIQSWLINTLAVLVTVVILDPHIRYAKMPDLFVASLLLGVLNAFIRPFMLLLALPLLIFTLGLFTLVINAALLYLVHWIMGAGFEVESFGWAMLGSLIISVISLPLNIMTGSGNTRLSVRRQQRRTDSKPDDGGNGPVIDV